jgi:hypothetical protein
MRRLATLSTSFATCSRTIHLRDRASRVMGRLLALDVGSKRIGVALSDEFGILASPHGMIRRQSANRDIAAVLALAQEFTVERIIGSSLACPWAVRANRLSRPATRRHLPNGSPRRLL